MNRVFFSMLTLMMSSQSVYATETGENAFLKPFIDGFASLSKSMFDIVFYEWQITDGVKVKLVIVWLIIASLWFTIYFSFINVRGFKHSIDLIAGKYTDPNKKRKEGQVSAFQALTAALSGSVGIGAIGGTAIAIGIGGMGAIFWIFIAGFLGMSVKFLECTLGVKYRNEYSDGKVSGGPMYYLSQGLKKRNMKLLVTYLVR